MPNPLNVPITPPRVAFIDPRTGNVSREWYMFFLSLFTLSGGSNISLDDVQKGPPTLTVDEVIGIINRSLGDLTPVSGTSELQAQLDTVRQELQLLPRAELGTMAQLQQANLPWVTFNTTAEGVPPDVGTVAWDGGTTLGVQATANVVIRVGESEYVYAKASAAITKGQLCYHTGAVGASGVITVAPTPLALADPNQIVGVAAETLATGAFGLIQISGDLRGFNTTGSSVGEVWADGDALYYNPAYVGSMTKVKPSAPNQKTYIGEVINAANAGSGSMHIRIVPGSVLGGTDSNVQFSALANKDFIQYDSLLQYWKNVAPSALTKTDDTNVTLTLGGSPTNALLAATSLTLGWNGQLSVARGGTGVSTTPANGQLLIGNGTGYTVANLTAGSNISITNTAGGISISSSNPGGTVTSVAALTLGTTGTDLSSTVANGTTTPVITLNVPTASATNRGALSSTDWSTFNGKQAALVSGTNIKTVNGTTLLGSGDLGTITVPYGGTGLTSLTAKYIPYGNGTGAFASSSGLQYDSAIGLGVGGAAVSGYKIASNGDFWLGNGAGTVIGTIINDGGWFGFAGSANVNGTKIKATNEVKFTIGSTDVVRIQVAEMFPASDNSKTLGLSSFRWSTVYAANGTINTSDARTKTEIAELDDAEQRVAVKLKKLIRKFKFVDSVAAKGDCARINVGVVAQDVLAAFAEEGLDAHRYGLFCFDKWDDQYEVENGSKKLIKPAGELYGIRYEQLLAFIVASL